MIDPVSQVTLIMLANMTVLILWSIWLLIKLAAIKIVILMSPQRPRSRGGGMVRATDRIGVDAG